MRILRLGVAVAALFFLHACFDYTVSGAGKERDTAIGHTMTGIAYKTFPQPLKRVRLAAQRTLRGMGMKVVGDRKGEDLDWLIRARNEEREVTVEFEIVDPTATRMRVIVSDGTPIFKDRKTGTEIITATQTELGQRRSR